MRTDALTIINRLLGRVHLSGRLDKLKPHQLDVVYEGMKVYKRICTDIPESLTLWPLDLPAWHDDWLAFGLIARAKRWHPIRLDMASWGIDQLLAAHCPFQRLQGRHC